MMHDHTGLGRCQFGWMEAPRSGSTVLSLSHREWHQSTFLGVMGFNHASCGVLAGVASLGVVPVDDPVSQTLWVVGVAGAALLPDLDTTNSSAARMWGPVSGLLAAGIGVVARGHRQGTHDLLLAPLSFGVLGWLASQHPLPAFAALTLLIGLSLRALTLLGVGRVGAMLNLLLAMAGAYWLNTQTQAGQLLPAAVALGVIVHILGDWVTTEGIPFPIAWLAGSPRRWAGGLFEVGSAAEVVLIVPVLTLTVLGLTLTHAGMRSPADAVAVAGEAIKHLVLLISG